MAACVAARLACSVTSLDSIYWQHQASLRKRGQADAVAKAREVAQRPEWVIEGVFGWLADVVAPEATALVWLDMPWQECRAGLVTRGPQFGESEAEFAGLLIWAEAYWTRSTGSSHAGHARIFAEFPRTKMALRSRTKMDAFVCQLTRDQ